MTLIKSNNNLNHHSRADEDDNNLHYPKGFISALKGCYSFKGHDDNLKYLQRPVLENALDEVDGQEAPPSENANDIYVLKRATSILEVASINWISGNTIEYTIEATPSFAEISIGDYLRSRNATNEINNGTFVITLIDDANDKIRVTNTNISSADYDEDTSPANCTWCKAEWDGAGDTDHVKFYSTEGKWFGITPEFGAMFLNTGTNKIKIFHSSLNWKDLKIFIEPNSIRKQERTVTPSATANTWGTAEDITPATYFSGLEIQNISILSGGTFGTETLTISLIATLSDETTLELRFNFTESGITISLTNSQHAALMKENTHITKLTTKAKSSINNSTATALITFTGYNN